MPPLFNAVAAMEMASSALHYHCIPYSTFGVFKCTTSRLDKILPFFFSLSLSLSHSHSLSFDSFCLVEHTTKVVERSVKKAWRNDY
jgi:hypothetical protein